jgi:hypothetical protein
MKFIKESERRRDVGDVGVGVGVVWVWGVGGMCTYNYDQNTNLASPLFLV